MLWVFLGRADDEVVDELDPMIFAVSRSWRVIWTSWALGSGPRWDGCAKRQSPRGRQNRALEHLPRMRERARERPERDHCPSDRLVLPIETDHPQAFLTGIIGVTVA